MPIIKTSLLFLALFAAVQSHAVAGPDTRPNVLVIVADDWSWPHAEPYGQSVVATPNFNRLAANGVLFHNAFAAAPTCTASRGALLTGQHPHRLEQGMNLWSILPARFATYPDILAIKGYQVGHSGKGWGPGTLDGSGRTHNPAGPTSPSFDAFLKTLPSEVPFCYWHGSQDPHRPYEKGSGLKSGLDPAKVTVPQFLPDTPEVRSDILDYLVEVRRFDETVGQILTSLEKTGRIENTLVVVTSDNGWPFPRSKANLHDGGTHVPLVVSWPKRITKRRALTDLVSLVDIAPTILEAVGLPPEPSMTGQSLIGLLTVGLDPLDRSTGQSKYFREFVVIERERHAYAREGNLGYPARALRMKDVLYIRNFKPERYPAGDPKQVSATVGPHGDIDPSPTKDVLIERARQAGGIERDAFASLAMGLRPEEELYEMGNDPFQVSSLTKVASKGTLLPGMGVRLGRWMVATGDPRARGEVEIWDKGPYTGGRGPGQGPPDVPDLHPADNTLTPIERQVGWRLLFDGKTSAGWTTDKKTPDLTPIRDGSINPHKSGGYMLVHEEAFDNFVLALDFKLSPGCNTGVFLRTSPLDPKPGKDVGENGLEIAIDDTKTSGYHDTGALYDLAKPSRNAMKPAGSWNHLLVVASGPDLMIEVNGQAVNRVHLSDFTLPHLRPDGSPHKFDAAFRDHPRKGSIGLQDHGGDCWYKNVKVLPLK